MFFHARNGSLFPVSRRLVPRDFLFMSEKNIVRAVSSKRIEALNDPESIREKLRMREVD